MPVEPTAATRPTSTRMLRVDLPDPPEGRTVRLGRPATLALGVLFVLIGGASLELGPFDARIGLASAEGIGPMGRVFGYWDPSTWPLPVALGSTWNLFEETGTTAGVVRWPSAIAAIVAGVLLARRARLTVGPRAGVLVALAWFGSVALMDRSAGLGLDLVAGLGMVGALDRLLSKGSGWAVGAWASLAFLAGGWPTVAVVALSTVVLGRKETSWSWSTTGPVAATVAAWSAWALSVAPAGAWASALGLPITRPSAWTLGLLVVGLGFPWAPFAILAKHRTIREGWPAEARRLVVGWLQVAGASTVVGSIVPGLATAATIPALAGLAVAVGACWDRIWEDSDSDDLAKAPKRWATRLALAIAGLWFVLVLALGGYLGFAVAYYRGTMIVLGLLGLAGFLLAIRGVRLGDPRWSLAAVAVVALALKLAHWGYFVPEWNYRNGAGPWGRAIGQWVPEKHPVYVLHAWPADLAFAINRPVRQLPAPLHLDYQPRKGSKFLLLQDSEYAEYEHWGQGWPRLIKVAEFEDEDGFGHRVLTRTDEPLIVERPYQKHDRE